jgi:hypothetical protein
MKGVDQGVLPLVEATVASEEHKMTLFPG